MAGTARIRDQGHIPICEFGEDEVDFIQLVVLEVTGQLGLDLEMLEQFSGVTGILRGDQHGLTQNSYRARRHVFKIANRRCDQVEGAHVGILSPQTHHLPYFLQ